MKAEEELQKDVQYAIKWEPSMKPAEIGVIANDGLVTLTGVVDSYTKKVEANRAAKNVVGVKEVVDKIEVAINNSIEINDADIVNEVVRAFKSRGDVPDDKIKVSAEKGWVTLEGDVTWNFQKEAANNIVDHLKGVKGVMNNINILPDSQDAIEQSDIEHALAGNWAVDDEDIHVRVSGSKVKLDGVVHSLYQKEEAARIAWNAPGVWTVENELVIE